MPARFEVATMELKPIRSKREHQAALKEIEALWNARAGTAEADRLEVLVVLVEAYERRHFPVEAPHPIDFLLHVMEARGLTRKDLERYIGSPARGAEGLKPGPPPPPGMIRRLATGLKLPADVLIRGYGLKKAA